MRILIILILSLLLYMLAIRYYNYYGKYDFPIDRTYVCYGDGPSFYYNIPKICTVNVVIGRGYDVVYNCDRFNYNSQLYNYKNCTLIPRKSLVGPQCIKVIAEYT